MRGTAVAVGVGVGVAVFVGVGVWVWVGTAVGVEVFDGVTVGTGAVTDAMGGRSAAELLQAAKRVSSMILKNPSEGDSFACSRPIICTF